MALIEFTVGCWEIQDGMDSGEWASKVSCGLRKNDLYYKKRMVMIYFTNSFLSFGERTILNDVTMTVPGNKRIALVGPNGAGKTTFLRLIDSRLPLDKGSIKKDKSVKIAFLPQTVNIDEDETILNYTLMAFKDMKRVEEEVDALNREISRIDVPEKLDVLLKRLGEKQTYLEQHHYFQREAEAGKVLEGLGVKEENFDRKIKTFSGGWQMRVYLARLLCERGNILLLDEPTNHLDIKTIKWLEDYIKEWEGAIVFVSHDRLFLDHLAEEVWYLNYGNIHAFKGNYTLFLKQWDDFISGLEKKKDKLQKKITHMNKYINRFRAKARHASGVKSKLKKLEKIKDDVPEIEKSSFDREFHFNLPNYQKSGAITLKLEGIKKSYAENEVFRDVDFEINRGEKIALIGPNGHGKSTLLRLITEEEKPDSGRVELGFQVSVAYYSQNEDNKLNPTMTVYDELFNEAVTEKVPLIRDLLGNFMFSGDDVYKKISVLSGGEKTRVSFAKLLLKEANFLILDEPTNHLDIPSKEALLNALNYYPGTVLLVSHDRFFVENFAEKILFLENKTMTYYPGNYPDFMDYWSKKAMFDNGDPAKKIKISGKKEERKKRALMLQSVSKERNELKKQIHCLEEKIEEWEREQSEIEKSLCLTEIYSDVEKCAELNRRLKEIPRQIQEAMDEWETAQESLDLLLGKIE